MSKEWLIRRSRREEIRVDEEGIIFSSLSGRFEEGSILPHLLLAKEEIKSSKWGKVLGEYQIQIYHEFVNILTSELDLKILAYCASVFPYSFSIESKGAIGRDNFGLDVAFADGHRPIYPERRGQILKWRSDFYVLPQQSHDLLEEVSAFNFLYKGGRQENEYLESLSRITQALDLGISGVSCDEFLKGQEIRVLTVVKPSMHVHANEAISLFPSIGIDLDQEWCQEFFAHDDVCSSYVVETPRGRLRVVIPEELKPLISDLLLPRARRISGDTKLRVLADVSTVFSEGSDFSLLDLALFSDRVKGITEVPATCRVSAIGVENRWFPDGEKSEKKEGSLEAKEPSISEFTIRTVDGKEFILQLESSEILNVFQQAYLDYRQGRQISSISFEGENYPIVLDDKLSDFLKSVFDEQFSNKKTLKFLDVISNEENLDYTKQVIEDAAGIYPVIPSGLKPGIDLKDYQKDGLGWMQRMIYGLEGERGFLLADEMGLGKTLQLLCLISWAIQDSEQFSKLSKQEPPYDPVLVVTPKALVDNWEGEIVKFFNNGGNHFKYKKLLASDYKKLRIERHKGDCELHLAQPTLDLEKIRENRMIITNYHSIRSYQHSIAKIDWSMVISDESQQLKNISQIYTSFLSLKTKIRICCTGTPVENSLEDLWHILDYAQPGLLDSKKRYRESFVAPLNQALKEDRSAEAQALLDQLRIKLKYHTPFSHLLRREKSQNLNLPEIEYLDRLVPLTSIERSAIQDVFQKLSATTANGAHLIALHELRGLSVHPPILGMSDDSAEISVDLLLKNSSKLRELVKILEEVKLLHEKVIIFSELKKSHGYLRKILSELFDLKVSVIYGDTPTGSSENSRINIIKTFSERRGFDVIVISPKAAGVGLNITAANHIIHFGRWWNPALEQQANARAYRIGQLKPVKVYQLIQIDPEGILEETYDQTLDKLLSTKSKVSGDFLLPSISEAEAEQALAAQIKTMSIGVDKGSPLKFENLYDLKWEDFEAFAAAVCIAMGMKVCLTPLAGDHGADVIALSDNEILYIQAKHTRNDRNTMNFDEDTKDLSRAYEYYENNLFKSEFVGHKRRNILFTNKRKTALSFRRNSDIEVWHKKDLEKLLDTHEVYLRDVYLAADRRAQGLADCRLSLL